MKLNLKRLKSWASIFTLMAFQGVTHADEDLVQGIAIMAQTGMYDLTAESTTKTSTSISGYGAHSGGIEVAVFDRYKLTAGLTFLLSSGISGDTATGYDVGLKYFFWTKAAKTQVNYDNVSLDTLESFRPYLGGALRNREFYSVLSTTYVGAGILVGVEYSLSRLLYSNFEVRYDSLSGNSDNTLTQTNILFGIGFNLK